MSFVECALGGGASSGEPHRAASETPLCGPVSWTHQGGREVLGEVTPVASVLRAALPARPRSYLSAPLPPKEQSRQPGTSPFLSDVHTTP